jgi:hypothetical protein
VYPYQEEICAGEVEKGHSRDRRRRAHSRDRINTKQQRLRHKERKEQKQKKTENEMHTTRTRVAVDLCHLCIYDFLCDSPTPEVQSDGGGLDVATSNRGQRERTKVRRT